MSKKTFLDKAYDIDGADGISKLYSEWADSYEAEVSANGYATPGRIASALASVSADKTQPILDYGCGTGLSGKAFRAHGFSNIVGADPSHEMLEIARSHNLYSRLVQLELDKPSPFNPGQFPTIAAVGVIGAGAAPIDVFDVLINLLNPGQRLTLSLNDHTLAVPEFPDRIAESVNSGEANLIFEEFGDHLPGQDMKSMIYILEKT